MSRSRRQLVLNVNVLDVGIAPGAWTLDDVHAHSFVDLDHFTRIAQIAERGTLDAFFLADGPGFWENPRVKPTRALEPSVILAAVATATENLGLIGTASTTFNDPRDLAERFLSLDYLSGGRVAWNVVTTYSPTAAANFGFDQIPDRDYRYRRAEAFVGVVTALWESARSGVPVSHHSEFFDVDGVLQVPPSEQGQPPLIQAGGSPAGRDLAGRTAHGVFSAELTLDAGRRHYKHVKDVARAAGRNPDDVKILPGLITVIGSTEAEAVARHEQLRAHVPAKFGWDRLSLTLGVPLAELDLDQPIPASLLDGPPPVDVRGFPRVPRISGRAGARAESDRGPASSRVGRRWRAPRRDRHTGSGGRHHRGVVPCRGGRRIQPDARRVAVRTRHLRRRSGAPAPQAGALPSRIRGEDPA
ncbi:probable nitrilotriacetate monooxygenase, component A [Rhodococcus jostii RHA1]|uniref:Probable nitrilotriacetate monooxygenase, component A n=1 Tax=Rhodococcus jostii (strain RHA1) TaxID=101510 RepID=Q0SFZ1_RHOJR|nr:probable nitrilotriacetate monooxygenase, component A [Rhodococcus jostii RHA1]